MCTNPRLVKHPRLRSLSFKQAILNLTIDSGLPESVAHRYIKETLPETIVVPCGRCPTCLRRRAAEWRTRLIHEIESSSNVVFVTLTIAPEWYSGKKTPVGQYLRDAFMRYRNVFKTAKGLKEPIPKHWFITELGELKGRLHLHGFIFNSRIWTPPNPQDLLSPRFSKGKKIYYNHLSTQLLRRVWQYGFADVAYSCSLKTASYATKYATKVDAAEAFFPRVYTSPGIGASFADAFRQTIRDAMVSGSFSPISAGRYRVPIPRYYKTRCFTADELAALSDSRQRSGLANPKGNIYYADGLQFNDLADYLSYCHSHKNDPWRNFRIETTTVGREKKVRYLSINPIKVGIYETLLLNYAETVSGTETDGFYENNPFNGFTERCNNVDTLELFESRSFEA